MVLVPTLGTGPGPSRLNRRNTTRRDSAVTPVSLARLSSGFGDGDQSAFSSKRETVKPTGVRAALTLASRASHGSLSQSVAVPVSW